MILIFILAPQPLAPGGTCPHLPSPSYATTSMRDVNTGLQRYVVLFMLMQPLTY